ncbi:hypothetical protein KSP40_PGU015128 [Platanthera guangdongensis]|uniref:Uncharacterized protein n=1 Tax=Platanthera guangdongensis TaxID=2320717 RepID=A0ABR2LD61_9ASPA
MPASPHSASQPPPRPHLAKPPLSATHLDPGEPPSVVLHEWIQGKTRLSFRISTVKQNLHLISDVATVLPATASAILPTSGLGAFCCTILYFLKIYVKWENSRNDV